MKAIAFFSSALTFSMAGSIASVIGGAAWGETLPQAIQPTVEFVDDSLVCYMQTSEGTTLNLNSLCGRNANLPNRQITVSQTNRSLPPGLMRYSNTNNGEVCVAIDQQGRPCQAAQ